MSLRIGIILNFQDVLSCALIANEHADAHLKAKVFAFFVLLTFGP